MDAETKLLIFVLVIMVGMAGVVAVEIVILADQAEARGCNNGVALNASQGRCFHP